MLSLFTSKKSALLAIVASVAIFTVLKLIFRESFIIVILFAIFFVYLIVCWIKLYLTPSVDLKEWAGQHGLQFFQQGKKEQIRNRFNVNPHKTYFKARNIFKLGNYVPIVPTLDNVLSVALQIDPNTVSGPYCEGEIKGRKVWVYPLFGKNEVTSTTSESSFSGWCMEIETIPIPIHALISRTNIDNFDKLNTESRKFENLYHTNSDFKAGALQLLDPNMIDIITHSNISAIEFGDRSIALMHTTMPARRTLLDNYLTWGLKIADQLERNFPLSN